MNIINDIFPFELINALGWTLLHSLWQGGIIAGILILILIALRKKTSQMKYLATIVAMMTILCLSTTTFCYYYLTPDTVAFGKEAMQVAHSTLSFTSTVPESANSVLQETATSFMDIKVFFQGYLPVIVIIWLVGIIIFLIKFTGGFFYTHRIKTYKTCIMPVIWQNKMRHLCEKMMIKRPVILLQSSIVRIPMVIGYFKPVILLPFSVLTGMPAHQLEMILIHELAHIYRSDYLVNILQSIMEILYFFHPAIWWISSTMRAEREHCCDDIVIKISKNTLDYARALAEIEKSAFLPVYAAVALMNKKNTLLNRIKRLTQQPKSSINFSAGLISALLIVFSIMTVAISSGNGDLLLQGQAENTKSSGFFNFDHTDEWWFPIIKKHNIELRAYSNFAQVLETGSSNRIDAGERITSDAIIIINAGKDYFILSSPEVVYSITDSTYLATDAKLDRFSRNDQTPISREKVTSARLEIKFGKNADGTPSICVTDLDKPQGRIGNNNWIPKLFSKPELLITESEQDTSSKKSILSGEWYADGWSMEDSLGTGSNIRFKTWHGVELEANKISFDQKTEVFETDLFKFLILNNKIIIHVSKNAQGKYTYNANEIYREGSIIRLYGNASLHAAGTKLKANEIIIDVAN